MSLYHNAFFLLLQYRVANFDELITTNVSQYFAVKKITRRDVIAENTDVSSRESYLPTAEHYLYEKKNYLGRIEKKNYCIIIIYISHICDAGLQSKLNNI